MAADRHWRSVFKTFIVCAAVVSVGMASGCDRAANLHATGGEIVTAPLGSISVYQLAGRLGMQVVESGPTSAFLRNPSNAVMVFTDPDGGAYVNGKAVSMEGGIVPVGGMLFLPEKYESAIRRVMRAAADEPARPKPRVIRRTGGGVGKTVVIDPGHGGKDTGAISVIGTNEKDVNLATAKMVARMLRDRGVHVIMTRRSDRFIELNDRAAIANRAKADLFVSLHADSCGNPSVTGFTVYVSRSASPQSHRVARSIVRAMSAAGSVSRGVHQANFRVLVRTSCPAVLVEMGYLSNRAEAMKLNQPGHRARLAEAISLGILNFLGRSN